MKKGYVFAVLILMITLTACKNNETPENELTTPIITLDDKKIILEVGDDFTSPSCTASNEEGSLLCVENLGTLDTSVLGTYTVSYHAVDKEGNKSLSKEVIVIVQDSTSPIITLSEHSVEVGYGNNMAYPTCTVSDNYDVDLNCTKDISDLNLNIPGVYNVVFSVTDSSGNIAALKTLEVTVVDLTAPVLTFTGADTAIEIGESYTIPSCSALDAIDGASTCVITPSTIDLTSLGTTVISVYAQDSKGNKSPTISYDLTVEDTVAPVVELEYSEFVMIKNAVFNEIGCSVTDKTVDTCTSEGSVDTSVAGDYPIVYSAVDGAGLSTEVTLIVTVLEGYFVEYENVLFNLKNGEVIRYNFTTGNDIIIPDEIYGVPVRTLSFELSDYYETFVNSISMGGQILEFNETFEDVIVPYENITITGSNPNAYEDRWADTSLPYPLYGYYYFDEFYGRITGYTGNETFVTIPSTINGITVRSIGKRAFLYNKYNDTLIVPGTVESIESRAFSSASFKHIILEEGIESIGSYAFNAYRLESVSIPQSIKETDYDCFSEIDFDKITFVGGYEQFYGDWIDIGLEIEDLPSSAYIVENGLYFVASANKIIKADSMINPVTVPATIDGTPVLEIGRYVFNAYEHTSVTLEEGLLIIGKSAFNYSSLESITIPASVVSIYDGAFASNFDLDTVTILGDSSRFDDSFEEIGFNTRETFVSGAFTYTSDGYITDYDVSIGGVNVIIPASIDGVNITHISYNIAFANKGILSVVLPEGIVEIGNRVFRDTLITELTIPASVEYVGYNLFTDPDLVTINFNGDPLTFYNSDFYEDFVIVKSNGLYFDEFTNTIVGYDYREISKDLVIPSQINGYDVLYIGYEAFDDAELRSVLLPEGLLGLDNEAFIDNEIETIILPSTLVYIGISVFYDNEISGTLVIPQGVKVIQYEAFAYNEITEVILPTDFQILNGKVFLSNALTTFNVPDSITVIGEAALSNNDLSGTLILPRDVVYIASSAFNSNNIGAITFNEKLEYIGEAAFQGNIITNLVIPNTVTYIGPHAFNDNLIEAVTLPTNITAIHAGTFKDNVITSIIIPDSVIEIGASAFENNLIAGMPTSITTPEGLVFIGQEAFRNNKISGVWVANSVIYIGDGAFAEQDNIGGIGFGADSETLARFAGEWNRITSVPVS